MSLEGNIRSSVYISASRDVTVNLATEEWLLRDIPEGEEILFLYENDAAVVIGRFQNPWRECRMGLSNRWGIPIRRRISGGGRGVGKLAFELLAVLDRSGDIPEVGELTAIEGIGPARASLVTGSLEFARRRLRPARHRISEPGDVLPLVSHWADRPQEYFLVLSLNGAHEVLRLRVVSQGILDRTIVHPREVFVDPLSDRAAAVICAHNHPSGNSEPSQEDRTLTRRLMKAGELLGIPLLDHVVFTQSAYYSFLEHNAL